ncbi:hypothetical protein SAMN05216338_105767 [Bradyrhizobium sp. Rc2d]|nr:hypothetical protein SAMN05216338_105767 [Bradyrhizobium sp. Rc2d]
MRTILVAIAAITFVVTGTTMLGSYPRLTKFHVASIAMGHCKNFHSLTGASGDYRSN